MKNIILTKHFVFLWSMIFIAGIATNVLAGSVDIPNTFIAGDTAMASEVNENFNAVETAVDDNDSRITTNTVDLADLANRSWEKSGDDLYYDNGNVGIGTTNPQAILHVSEPWMMGTSSGILPMWWGIGTNGWLTSSTGIFYDAGGTIYAHHFSAYGGGDIVRFGTSGGEGQEPDIKVVISNDGNVGIGTTSPQAKLHVAEPWIIGSSSGLLPEWWDIGTNGWLTSSTGIFYDAGGTIYAHHFSAYGGGDIVRFGTSAGEGEAPDIKVVITNDGNVGIGTESPQGSLDVNGAIYQRGSVLHADYVFETDYKLESIEEHAEFMQKEKHLKAVPKAKKDKNGNDIIEYGSHLKGMLEELEKAHIYIVQLNDVIKKQQETISTLSKQVNILAKQAE